MLEFSNEFCLNHRMKNAWIIQWIMLALSNEFCSNHPMNISWIIEWIMLALSNEFCPNHRMNKAWIIEWIMLALSNEFCSNHRMNISWIIEWILLALFHKCRRESNAYQGEFIEFCYNFIECISKMKHIWILLSICGNNQTHISDIEYWHISATIVNNLKARHC